MQGTMITETCPVPYKEPMTKAQARKQIRDMEKRHKRSKHIPVVLQAYECVGHWHVANRRNRRHI